MDCQLSPFIYGKDQGDEAWGLGFTDDRYFGLRLLAMHDAGITSFL